MNDRPNVLMLTVDALRADRASVLGYARETTPNLERMAENAIVCSEATSPAAFTHICFPSLMTSTLPFSHGGYDNGPVGRPATVFEAFHDAGYDTTAFCTTHWVSRNQGYDKGIDNEHALYVLNTLPGLVLALSRSTLAAWHCGEIEDAAAVAHMTTVFPKFFDGLVAYAEARRNNAAGEKRDYPNARFVTDGYDFDRVIGLAERHRRAFEADPLSYLKQNFRRIPKGHEWLGREWRYYRRPGKFVGHGLDVLANRIIAAANPSLARLRAYRGKRYVDGADVTSRIVRLIHEWDRRKPFFIWNHYQDTHVPYCAGYGTRWYRQTPDYLKALGHDPSTDVAVAVGGKPETDSQWTAWSALYDAAIRFTDEQIGRIVQALEEKGIAEDTIIVVAGDHGEELGEHGDISHHFRLYSHNVRIPMLFYRKGMAPTRINGLTSLIDLAPTLTQLANIPSPRGWRGVPVTDTAVDARRFLVLETFYGGNSLFDLRPPYMAVRTRNHNFMWKEFLDPDDRVSPENSELYDVVSDPDEKRNLYRPDHPLVADFEAAIRDRLRRIPEFDDARIRAAFPHLETPDRKKAAP